MAPRALPYRPSSAAGLPLRVILPEAPGTLDPQRAFSAADRAVARQLFEPLLRFGAGPQPEPGAAEGATPNEDATRWHFSLRPGLAWSDGRPLDAADFVRGWLRVLSRDVPDELFLSFRPIFGAGVYRFGLVDAETVGVRAPNPRTVEVRTDGPAAHLPHLAALWLASPAADDPPTAARPMATDRSMAGNGPYVLVAWERDRSLTLAPNERYWAGPPQNALALLAGPRLAENALTDFAAGAGPEPLPAGAAPADLVPVPAPLQGSVLRDERLRPLLVRQPRPATLWLTCNTTRPPLDDARVRKALAYAIDRQACVAALLDGAGRPAYSLLPEGVLGHDPAAGSVYRLRPDVARAIVAALDVDETRWEGVAVTVPATPEGRRAGQFLRTQLQQHLGVQIGVTELDRYSYARALERRLFHLSFGGWESLYPDPEAWFWLTFGAEKAENRTGWRSALLDRFWREADEVTDAERRLGLYAAAQQVLLDEMPVIFLAQPERLAVVHPRVQGLLPGAMDEIPGAGTLSRVHLRPDAA